jgi:hypothetical protein
MCVIYYLLTLIVEQCSVQPSPFNQAYTISYKAGVLTTVAGNNLKDPKILVIRKKVSLENLNFRLVCRIGHFTASTNWTSSTIKCSVVIIKYRSKDLYFFCDNLCGLSSTTNDSWEHLRTMTCASGWSPKERVMAHSFITGNY